MKKVDVYTDGACSHNGSWSGGWAVVVVDKETQQLIDTVGGGEPETTNNRMEMMAFLEALKYLEKEGLIGVIHTDSAYVHNAFKQDWISNWKRNGWKNSKKQDVKNQDLWKEMLNYFIPEIVKVKGHADDKFNNMADEIAVEWRSKT